MKNQFKIILIIIFLAFASFLLYAGKRWYSHESEVNAKLWEIQAATERIADSLAEKEDPYIDLLEKTVFEEILSNIEEKNNNAYLKLSAGEDINLLIVGDSISAQDWTEEIAEQISYHFGSKCDITNISMGGNTSYAGYVRANILDDRHFDLVLICFGQNDTDVDFEIFYEATVRAVLENNPDIKIISVLESSQRTYTEKINKIIEIADYYDASVADTIAEYNNSGYSYEALSPDGVHPGELGKELYLNTVMETIYSQVKENVSAAVKALTGQYTEQKNTSSEEARSIKPEKKKKTALLKDCIFISAEQFTRINEVNFSVSVPNYKGLLGIYCVRLPGKNDINVFCESELICSYSEDFNHSFTQEMIFLLDKGQHELTGNIEVVFNTQEQAERFRGLIISTGILQNDNFFDEPDE